jgi:hypothetical protein
MAEFLDEVTTTRLKPGTMKKATCPKRKSDVNGLGICRRDSPGEGPVSKKFETDKDPIKKAQHPSP